VDTAELLLEARRSAGLTQAELARRAGTSQAMVARYETGVASPTVRTLRRLLRAANRDLELSTVSPKIAASASPLARTLRAHRAEINSAAERVGARNVRVFGSVARGEDTPESDVDLLADIRDAAARAQQAVDAMERASAGRDDDAEQLAFDALLYRLLVIGEAVRSLPADLLAREPQVPWREISRLRDLLAQNYYRVDPQIIRRTVDAPLRDLQAAARRLLDGPPPGK
jgi:uncharacterized protein with HEPN domain/DNA-binding XRE family transcriptional regulator